MGYEALLDIATRSIFISQLVIGLGHRILLNTQIRSK